MANKLVVKITRVQEGDLSSEPVVLGGFVRSVVPCLGYIIKPEWPGTMPVFIRDTDLVAAEEMRDVKGRPVAIVAESWR